MKFSQSFRCLAAGVVTVSMLLASAHGAAYIKFDGLDGESQDRDHKGWIDVFSTAHGLLLPAVQSARESGRTASSPTFSDLTVTKELDKSTPKLIEACARGKKFSSVVLEYTKGEDGAAPQAYYAYELKNVQVTSYSISSGGDRPTESLSLNFEEIKVTYSYQDESGTTHKVETGWDVRNNSPLKSDQVVKEPSEK